MILMVDLNSHPLASPEFILPIARIVKERYDIIIRHHSELTKDELATAEKIVLSGAPLQDHEYLNHLDDFAWLKICEQPVLGICAGMQLLGTLFGSPLKNCLEIGMTVVRTMAANPLFSGGFQTYELHSLALEPSEEFEVLAVSDSCVQAIRHREKRIFGVLFHPEVRNQDVIERFCEL